MVLVDVFLYTPHPAFIRKDNHHGGVTLVWQQDDAGVVRSVLKDVVVSRPYHHVNLNFGPAVNMEVRLMCHFTIKWFLPVSCPTQWRVVMTILGCVSINHTTC